MSMLFSSGRRIGFGSMQLTGPGHRAAPDDPGRAMQVLRDAVDAGVTHIDTADAYGPFTAEKYIRKALLPYPDGLVIATKGGLTRQGPNQWAPCGRPESLRQCVEIGLGQLRVERIELYYLHRVDPAVALEDQLAVLRDMQAEGKIGNCGLSKVTSEQLRTAGELVEVAAVQNRYNVTSRASEDVLRHCEMTGVSFVPYAPPASGRLGKPHCVLHELATQYGATPAQLALAWLLHHSPAVAPIPGTSSSAPVRENLAAEQIKLTPEAMTAIELAATGRKLGGRA
ncbi:aldo/keto reductase [Actinosynnema sp. NPDC050436]|uniref:aldo/keto reductase n=1 Tax=Actinosynnema sp. NPDC050436 TaxID=3155659 RepID=UPI0033E4F32C